MPQVALTADEVTALAGPSTRKTYMKAVPETSVATALINMSAFSYPLATLTVDNTSAGWSNVKKGMTVLIGTSAGARDVGVYRVRENVSGTTTLHIGEMGRADVGQIAIQLQTPLADNQYITVISARRLHAVYPRIVYNPPISEIFEDYDENAAAWVQYPAPIVNVTTNGRRGGHLGVKVADGATVAITSTVSVAHWPTSASATYSWTVPGSFSSVSGASSATLTATAPVGNHEIRCLVTPNVGVAIEVVRYLLICDDSTNPPIPIQITGDSRSRDGRRIGVRLIDDTLADFADGALCIVFDAATWNGGDVASASKQMVGYVSRVSNSITPGLRSAEAEIVSPSKILKQLINESQIWEQTPGLPLNWQQVRSTMCNLNFVLWWILTFRVANALVLFNYNPISTAASSARNTGFEISKGSIWGQLQGLARRYGEAAFTCTSEGEFFFRRHPNMQSYSSRSSAVVTRDSITVSRAADIRYERSMRPTVRKVTGFAFWWDGLSTQPTTLKAEAPERPGQGNSDDEISDWLVDGSTPQDTLNMLTGLYYSWRNAPISRITVTIRKNRDVYEPAELNFVPVTIPAAYAPNGVAWSPNGIVDEVNKRYLPNGATEIELTLEVETKGADGVTRNVRPPGSGISPDTPDLPDPWILDQQPDLDGWGDDDDFDPTTPDVRDPDPDATPTYGEIAFATSDAHVPYATFPAGSLTFADKSPSAAIRSALEPAIWLERNPHSLKSHLLYCKWGIARTPDIELAAPEWKVIRDAVSAGISDCGALDLTIGHTGVEKGSLPYGVAGHTLYNPLSIGTFTPGTGWVGESQSDGSGHFVYGVTLSITPTCPLRFTGGVEFTATASATHSVYTELQYRKVGESTWTSGSGGNISYASGTHNYTASLTTGTNYVEEIMLIFRVAYGGSPPPPDTFTITAVELKTCAFEDCGTILLVEEFIGDLVALQDKAKGWMWLTKRLNADGVHYDVYFNRTLDDFSTVWSVRIARWASNMVYAIAPCPHDYKRIYVSAGDPANSDAYVYYSGDGGGTFTATTRTLTTRGGLLLWNWSTGTPNTPNIDASNLIIGVGLDGSNNYKVTKGISGTPATVATGSGKYPLHARALWSQPRDGDNLYLVFQDKSLYKSTNFVTSWSAVTSVPGSGVPQGAMGYPADATFLLTFGQDALAYTTDSGAAQTDIQPTYDTFADAQYGSGNGATIVAAQVKISDKYPVPVVGGAS